MKSQRPVSTVLLALLLTALPLGTSAQDKAQLPYSVVNSYLELFKSLVHLDLILPSMMIAAINPEVTPPEIEFMLVTPDGRQAFSPGETGVIEFPDQPDWANLNLISNQPKGTLQLVIGFAARRLDSTRISYQGLMGLVPQFEEAMTALANMQDQPPPKIKGLTIQLSEGTSAAVHIVAQKGKQTLKPLSSGVVIIKYNEALWGENPPVEFDEIPIGIFPLR